MRQLAFGHGGEVLHRQHGEIGVEAPGAQLQRGIAAGMVQLDLGAFGQLADDLVQGGGRGGGAARAGDLHPGHLLDHRDFHVGRGQLQHAVLGREQHIGQDGDGVAALDHALDMRQRLDQDRPFDRELHLTQAPPIRSTDAAVPPVQTAPGGHPNSADSQAKAAAFGRGRLRSPASSAATSHPRRSRHRPPSAPPRGRRRASPWCGRDCRSGGRSRAGCAG